MKPCVLLDGGFDPLHAGHLSYIKTARLAFPEHQIVVSVCSDEDIRAKGREPLLDQMARVSIIGALRDVDRVIAKTAPTEQLIASLKPGAYVKGKDWENRLPDEQLVACSLYGVQIVYLNTVTDSSSDVLRRWALADCERGLSRLETFMAEQQPASAPWQPVTDYSFDARRKIEGKHPELIRDVFQPTRALDVGCGRSAILVRLLRAIGVPAFGFDPCGLGNPHGWDAHVPKAGVVFPGSILSAALVDDIRKHQPPHDLVICREVLEHLTVHQIGIAVANLFRLSSKFVYITTRFSDKGVFDADTDFETDPTHITCLSQPFLRALCVLNGGKRRRDLETRLDWQNKGRVLVYEI